ncbi:hypothetical protein OAC06_01570 [Alphaproteobacteria bacterium]|nr:hypothetical protein [Alphaproteobacteria bacterium]
MLIFLMKEKLTHTDLIFPILAALKKKNPHIKIRLIFPSKSCLSLIKANNALYKSLIGLAEIKYFYWSQEINIPLIPNLFSGIIAVVHRNFLMKNLLFQKVFIFRINDIPRINWLISLNRYFFKGKKISLFLHSFEFDKFMSTVRRVIQANKVAEDAPYSGPLNTDSDILISSYNYDQLKKIYKNISRHNYSVTNVGSELFNWPTWKNIIIKNSKSDIKMLPKDFIFFPLAILIRKDLQGNLEHDFRESIIDIIRFIREKNENIIIIFRPHPTTKIEELNILLKENNIKKFMISNINPIVLSKYCSFVVRYGVSLLDSRVMDSGKYLIRYFYDKLAEEMKEELQYNKEFYKKYNFIDVTDKKVLQKTIHKALDNNKDKEPVKDNENYEDTAINNIFKIINTTDY